MLISNTKVIFKILPNGRTCIVIMMYAFLTDVVVFPQVAEGHVACQQHSHTADASLLHIDVLVVVSVMAWRRRRKISINHR